MTTNVFDLKKKVDERMIELFNEGKINIKNKILSNNSDKINVNKLKKLDKVDKEALRVLADMKINEYQFDKILMQTIIKMM